MGDNEKIKPCAFCGSKEVEIARTNENACWVECANCGANRDAVASREQAIKLWNERHFGDGEYATIVYDMEKE